MTYTPTVGHRIRLNITKDAHTESHAGVVAEVYRFCGVRMACDSGEERYWSADEVERYRDGSYPTNGVADAHDNQAAPA